MSQKQKILNLLIDREWVCTSDMYALYIADVRRRLVDLKKDGYILASRKCEQHDYHAGGSKEWHLISPPNTLNSYNIHSVLNQMKKIEFGSPTGEYSLKQEALL